MKKMKKLDPASLDLEMLAEALEDHSPDASWWIDPNTGEVLFWTDAAPEGPHPAERGYRRVEPLDSSESYRDMADFIGRLRDRRARDLLGRAIEGRGAFRRFKDTLHELPEVRSAWFAFHDARMARRAVDWLREEGLVHDASAETAIAAHPDPALPVFGPAFDAEATARKIAADLKDLYGARLHEVRIFGSWARGDATPESDLDLLVVLDPLDDPWEELERMDEVLWQATLATGVIASAIPVSSKELASAATPFLARVRAEGRHVA